MRLPAQAGIQGCPSVPPTGPATSALGEGSCGQGVETPDGHRTGQARRCSVLSPAQRVGCPRGGARHPSPAARGVSRPRVRVVATDAEAPEAGNRRAAHGARVGGTSAGAPHWCRQSAGAIGDAPPRTAPTFRRSRPTSDATRPTSRPGLSERRCDAVLHHRLHPRSGAAASPGAVSLRSRGVVAVPVWRGRQSAVALDALREHRVVAGERPNPAGSFADQAQHPVPFAVAVGG